MSAVPQPQVELHSPQGVYMVGCRTLGCRRNTQLMRMLSRRADGWGQLTEIDLNSNLLGKLGIQPVLGVIARAGSLLRLCLANNGLDDTSVAALLAGVERLHAPLPPHPNPLKRERIAASSKAASPGCAGNGLLTRFQGRGKS